MEPERRGSHGNIQDHCDAGSMHLVHHPVKPVEFKLAVLQFVAVSGKVSHPNDTEPGLLHQLNVTRSSLRV